MSGNDRNQLGVAKSSQPWPIRVITLIARYVEKAASGFAVCTSLAIIVMMVVGGADVIGNKLFNHSVPATVELTETLMVAVVFGGLAYAQARRAHVRVEFLFWRVSEQTRNFMDLAAVAIGSIFFILMTWQCTLFFWFSWINKETDTGLYRFPVYPAKLIMLLGSVLMTLQLLSDLIRVSTAIINNRRKSVQGS